VTPERIDLLAGALEVEEALLSLKSLVARFPSTPGAAMSKLARALRGGCAPLLEHFDVCFANLTEESLNLLADGEGTCTHSWLPEIKNFRIGF